MFVQCRCVFSLRAPVVLVALSASEACGLQGAVAALFTACLNAGPRTGRHANHTGQGDTGVNTIDCVKKVFISIRSYKTKIILIKQLSELKKVTNHRGALSIVTKAVLPTKLQ